MTTDNILPNLIVLQEYRFFHYTLIRQHWSKLLIMSLYNLGGKWWNNHSLHGYWVVIMSSWLWYLPLVCVWKINFGPRGYSYIVCREHTEMTCIELVLCLQNTTVPALGSYCPICLLPLSNVSKRLWEHDDLIYVMTYIVARLITRQPSTRTTADILPGTIPVSMYRRHRREVCYTNVNGGV